MTHRGQIVEKIIRKSGYKLVKLAEKLDITRNTLYNKFKNPNLNYRFIMRVGNVIHYDFTIDFPEIKQQPNLITENTRSILDKEDTSSHLYKLEIKYTHLLEKYTRLFEKLIKIANENENELHSSLRQEIQKLIEIE